MDHDIFLAINGLAGKSSFFDAIGRFFGGDYFLYLLVLVVAVLVFDPQMRKRVVLALGSAFIARVGITEILKRLVSRSRPYEILDVNRLTVENEMANSFPSGHTTIYFAIAFAFYGTKYFWPFLILAIIGSVGRIYVGMHYPLDILAGATIGAVTSLIVLRLFKSQIKSYNIEK